MAVATDNTVSPGTLSAEFHDLARQLGEMGMNLALWDRHASRIDSLEPACGLCRMIQHGCPGDRRATAALVSQVLADDRPATGCGTFGCGLLAVPLRHRRRIVGIASACFPTTELLGSNELLKLASALQVDPSELTATAERSCRHSAAKAPDLLQMLEFVTSREHELRVASNELATLSTNLASTYEELSLLYRISGSMKVTKKPHEFLQGVVDDLLEVMNIEAAAGVVYAYPPETDDQVVLAGAIDLNADQVRLLTATRIAGGNRAVLDNAFVRDAGSGLGQAVQSLCAAPLLIDDKPIGALIAFNRQGEFDGTHLKLLNSIAGQAAVFLQNSRLFADVQELVMGVLHALTASIDAKDPYTCGHSQRVAAVSLMLAKAAKLPPARVERVYLSGLLHDVGKIGVPESVLCKDGRLTDEEYAQIKKHPRTGAKILEGIRQLHDVVPAVVTHHERPDGRGYPCGLKGDEVPVEGLIVGLADVFDAMTSDRTYRKALPLDRVMTEIDRCAGTQFDQRLVTLLHELGPEKVLEQMRRAAYSVLSPPQEKP